MRRSALLSDVAHGFTGVAEGDLRPPAEAAAGALVAALGGEGRLGTVSQVHGARVVDVALADGRTEADAVLSTRVGAVIAVRVADCVPILLAAPGAVAAVHAGWRGTAADIVRASLSALCTATGARPSQVRAAVGPCICGACYEVGDEVIEAVGRVTPGRGWLAGRHVDLAAANAAILEGEGARVDVLGLCTRCGPGFWSHRRDGAAGGRQAAAIRL